MTPDNIHEHRADLVSAWATGAGAGLIALMVTWLVGNRLFGLLFESPRGPTVAILTAVTVGFATTALFGRRLAATVRTT